MKLSVLLAFVVTLAAVAYGDEVKSYEGYKTYRLLAFGEEQLALLRQLSQDEVYDFWSQPRALAQNIDVFISPEQDAQFLETMKKYDIPATVIIQNYKEIIERENQEMAKVAPRKAGEKITFDRYYRYDDIVDYINELADSYPDLVKVETIGTTYEGRDIKGMTISSGGNGKKNAILLEGGIHAREWLAPAILLYLINQLVEVKANSALLDDLDVLIVPVTNPDGYEYTNTNDRMWRKNRNAVNALCKGADANRNFGFHWGGEGASTNPCSETYRGANAFSEAESSAVRDFGLENEGRVKVYIATHSYGPYFLYPWGYQWDLPDDWEDLDDLAQEASAAIRAVAGTRYEIGSSTQVLYAAAGGSDDYMKGGQGVAYSYTVELPGGGSQGFNPPPSDILPRAKETFEGLKVVLKKAASL